MCAHSRKKLSYPPPGHIIEQSVLVECIIQQTSPLKVKSRGENHRKWGQVAFVSSALYLLFVLLNILAPLLRFIDSVYSSWNELHKFVVLFTLLGMFSPSVFLKEKSCPPNFILNISVYMGTQKQSQTEAETGVLVTDMKNTTEEHSEHVQWTFFSLAAETSKSNS